MDAVDRVEIGTRRIFLVEQDRVILGTNRGLGRSRRCSRCGGSLGGAAMVWWMFAMELVKGVDSSRYG